MHPIQVKKLINHLGFWDKACINALLRELPILIAAAEDINPDVDRSPLIFSEGRSDAAYIRYLLKDWKSVLLFLIDLCQDWLHWKLKWTYDVAFVNIH